MNRIVQFAAIILSASCCWLAGTAQAQEAPAVGYQGTNHSQFVGDFAIGLMGTGQVSFVDGAGAPNVLSVPIVGARYWMESDMGIDVGLGLSMAGSSTENGDTTTDIPEPTVIVLHGGVPLVMADSKYWVLEVIPEMNLGYAANTIDGDPDTVLRGFHLDMGARAGAELHFGFIDIPQLSLQAGVGLALSYDSFTQSVGDLDSGRSRWTFGTVRGPDPWDFLTSSITALYYFGG